MRQNRCLVSECFTEPGAGSPRKYTPEAEAKKIPPTGEAGKTPLAEHVKGVPMDEQEPTCIVVEEDDVMELHAEMEDL